MIGKAMSSSWHTQTMAADTHEPGMNYTLPHFLLQFSMYQPPDQCLQWVRLNPEAWHSSFHNSWHLLELSTISSPWQSWCYNSCLWFFTPCPCSCAHLLSNLTLPSTFAHRSIFITFFKAHNGVSSIKMESLILSKCKHLLVEEEYSHILKLFLLWLSSFLSSYLITTYL